MEAIHDVKAYSILALRQAVESKEYYLAVKRQFDITASFILIILFLPLMLITAVLIKLTSRGPAIFKQKRAGLYGKEFIIYKFRTMYYDDKNDLENFLPTENVEKSEFKKTKCDPRVTPLGRYLRQTSIDELPQLFNILRGDMSLVGPRPMIDFYFKSFPNTLDLRAVVKPGLTGLWQITSRGNISTIHDMLHYDLEYIKNISFMTDIKILLRTIPTVIMCEGAI